MRLLSLLVLGLAGPAISQEVSNCDWRAVPANIAEPWSENTRVFANGAVRVAALDTVEPALGFAYFLVISPPRDDLGIRQCQLVGGPTGMGFAGMDFDGLAATYDPAIGLNFEVIVQVYDPETDTTPRRLLSVTVNQATGGVAAQLWADNL
ncbi:MAG: hypothetical protein AAFU41_04265 [Pseudomonadota bacterium]